MEVVAVETYFALWAFIHTFLLLVPLMHYERFSFDAINGLWYAWYWKVQILPWQCPKNALYISG